MMYSMEVKCVKEHFLLYAVLCKLKDITVT